MKTERDKLIEENLNLYYTFVNQQKSKGFHPQLLEEINYRCMIGFINACDKYDKEHDSRAQFQTLAWQSMNNQLINAINYNNRNKRKVNSYTDSIQEQEESLIGDNVITAKNITPTEDFAYPDELTPILNEIIEGLPDNDKELIDMIIYQKLTHREIGEKMGKSTSWSQWLWKDLMRRIKNQLMEHL